MEAEQSFCEHKWSSYVGLRCQEWQWDAFVPSIWIYPYYLTAGVQQHCRIGPYVICLSSCWASEIEQQKEFRHFVSQLPALTLDFLTSTQPTVWNDSAVMIPKFTHSIHYITKWFCCHFGRRVCTPCGWKGQQLTPFVIPAGSRRLIYISHRLAFPYLQQIIFLLMLTTKWQLRCLLERVRSITTEA